MIEKPMEDLLSADHRGLADSLATRPTEVTVARMKRRAWRKSLVIAVAAASGSMLAAAQLPVLARIPLEHLGPWGSEMLGAAAALLTGLVLAATVLGITDID